MKNSDEISLSESDWDNVFRIIERKQEEYQGKMGISFSTNDDSYAHPALVAAATAAAHMAANTTDVQTFVAEKVADAVSAAVAAVKGS